MDRIRVKDQEEEARNEGPLYAAMAPGVVIPVAPPRERAQLWEQVRDLQLALNSARAEVEAERAAHRRSRAEMSEATEVAHAILNLQRLLALGGAFDRKAAWDALQDGHCPDCAVALPSNGLCHCENDE